MQHETEELNKNLYLYFLIFFIHFFPYFYLEALDFTLTYTFVSFYAQIPALS